MPSLTLNPVLTLLCKYCCGFSIFTVEIHTSLQNSNKTKMVADKYRDGKNTDSLHPFLYFHYLHVLLPAYSNTMKLSYYCTQQLQITAYWSIHTEA